MPFYLLVYIIANVKWIIKWGVGALKLWICLNFVMIEGVEESLFIVLMRTDGNKFIGESSSIFYFLHWVLSFLNFRASSILGIFD